MTKYNKTDFLEAQDEAQKEEEAWEAQKAEQSQLWDYEDSRGVEAIKNINTYLVSMPLPK